MKKKEDSRGAKPRKPQTDKLLLLLGHNNCDFNAVATFYGTKKSFGQATQRGEEKV